MISIFKGSDSSSESCTDGLVCVKAQDDAPTGCAVTTKLGTNLPGDNTYYILIHGYDSDTGNFELTVSRDDELITPEPTLYPTESPTTTPKPTVSHHPTFNSVLPTPYSTTSVCPREGQVPSNNECTSSTQIPLPETNGNTTVNGTSCFSTEENEAYVPASCDDDNYESPTTRGVWYTVTIPEGTGTQYMT